jgi:hypothetical protein
MGKQTFFWVRKSQIVKFLGSFRYRRYENFLGMPVSKSQIRKFVLLIRKFLQNTAQLCFKSFLKVVFLQNFCIMYTF